MKRNDIIIMVNGQPIKNITGIEFTMSAEDIVARMKVQTTISILEFEGNMKTVNTTYTETK